MYSLLHSWVNSPRVAADRAQLPRGIHPNSWFLVFFGLYFYTSRTRDAVFCSPEAGKRMYVRSFSSS